MENFLLSIAMAQIFFAGIYFLVSFFLKPERFCVHAMIISVFILLMEIVESILRGNVNIVSYILWVFILIYHAIKLRKLKVIKK